MEYRNPKVERLSAEELKQLQERKLRRSVENAYEYSSFYKKRFAAARLLCHTTLIDIMKGLACSENRRGDTSL